MKKTITILVLLISSLLYCQEVKELEVIPTGVNGYVIKNFEGKNDVFIYEKLKKWIEYNIKNPDFSIKNDVKNEYIKFTISNVGKVTAKFKGVWKLNLDVEIRIKNEKIRIDIGINKIYGESGEMPLLITGGSLSPSIYRNEKVRNGYDLIKKTVDESLNNFVLEISNSILGTSDYKKTDW